MVEKNETTTYKVGSFFGDYFARFLKDLDDEEKVKQLAAIIDVKAKSSPEFIKNSSQTLGDSIIDMPKDQSTNVMKGFNDSYSAYGEPKK